MQIFIGIIFSLILIVPSVLLLKEKKDTKFNIYLWIMLFLGVINTIVLLYVIFGNSYNPVPPGTPLTA